VSLAEHNTNQGTVLEGVGILIDRAKTSLDGSRENRWSSNNNYWPALAANFLTMVSPSLRSPSFRTEE
jgi:hypothetical protein